MSENPPPSKIRYDADSPASQSSNRLQALAVMERPQERLQRLGATNLSDGELLAMLLRSGTRGQDVLSLAERLLSAAGSLHRLTHWTEKDFRRLKGIGPVKALQLLTVMEIAKRVLVQGLGEDPIIDKPEHVVDYLRAEAIGLSVEKFWTLCLDRKNRLLRCVEVTSGTASSTLAHPREVFREAIREGASAVVCAHNHPSGDPAPSNADMQITRQLREAAKAVQIPLHDHVIIGRIEHDPTRCGYYSFRDAGIV